MYKLSLSWFPYEIGQDGEKIFSSVKRGQNAPHLSGPQAVIIRWGQQLWSEAQKRSDTSGTCVKTGGNKKFTRQLAVEEQIGTNRPYLCAKHLSTRTR